MGKGALVAERQQGFDDPESYTHPEMGRFEIRANSIDAVEDDITMMMFRRKPNSAPPMFEGVG